MCGIIGIIARDAVAAGLLEGLRRLEYRGYDSAGIATLVDGRIECRRAEGKLVNLANRLDREPVQGLIGIGHTRWATHGLPTETNAHPIATDRVAVVHNGIIENFQALRHELTALGHGDLCAVCEREVGDRESRVVVAHHRADDELGVHRDEASRCEHDQAATGGGAGRVGFVRRFDPRGELQRRALCPAARARDGRPDRAGRRRARGPRGWERQRRATRGPQVQARAPRERLGARVAARGTPRTVLRRESLSRCPTGSARASPPGGGPGPDRRHHADRIGYPHRT